MQYKLLVDKETHISHHEVVVRHDDEKPKHDWKDEAQMPDKYAGHRKQIMRILTKIQSMRDEHLGQKNNVKHCIELTPDNNQLIRYFPYQAGPTVREFEKV